MAHDPAIETVGRVRIASLADRLDAIDTIAQWHWEVWGDEDPIGPATAWAARLRERANRMAIPATYIAITEDGELVGTASLIAEDLASRHDLSPWLAGVYVIPAWRGRGVGSALTRHAVAEAAAMGTRRLYLHTEHARALYERLGWRAIATDHRQGHDLVVMTIETGAGS
ncbi:MAG: GNAT family N-acetyltransferase [Thermomicrobiales bacterium]|nr:GNAT family N-acetyltransferase [Thermomicrobiales bacterium]